LKTTLRVLVLLLIGMMVVFAGAAWLMLRPPADAIARGVTVAGVDVGGLTPAEAAAALARALPAPDVADVTLTAAGLEWRLPWDNVGQQYDIAATVQAAADAERNTAVPPVVVPADPARVTAFLEKEVAPALAIAPTDATLTLINGAAVESPAQVGRRLDVAASAPRVLAALAAGDAAVELALAEVPPQRPAPEPARAQAATWLSGPFVLVVDDPLTGPLDENELPTGYYTEFTAASADIAHWLTVSEEGAAVRLHVDFQAVRAWVAGVAPQVGAERQLDVEATLTNLLAAFYAGERRAFARVTHPTGSYTIQPGDTLSLIAYDHQMPMWQFKRANPDIDPGAIDVGQVITIPSVDVLFPHPLIPGKRIDVDLFQQQVRVFENSAQIYTFTVSTGISRTPTIAGQFQILFKEEDAFAKRWQLDMPYFMGVYEEDEGFYNGFHELPITHYGTRLSAGVLGYPASFGCIILDVGDAETLYHWADVGTLVHIIGYAPGTPSWQQTLADLAPLEGTGDGE